MMGAAPPGQGLPRFPDRADVFAAARVAVVAGAAFPGGGGRVGRLLVLDLQQDGQRVHGRPDAAAGHSIAAHEEHVVPPAQSRERIHKWGPM